MEINPEVLLGRKENLLDIRIAQAEILGRRVLITGAAGSIGSEIVKEILKLNPDQIYLVDHWELGIHLLKRKFKAFRNVKYLLGDITDKHYMSVLLKEFRPQIIFHAAAYKHVSLLETAPYQSIKVNVLGTQILADLAVKSGVKKFVFISSDKAVNPSGNLGISKRLAELYLQSFHHTETSFIITRFGNVLGSTGSVLETFRNQIRNKEEIIITNAQATRYFMTIPEASGFVVVASAIGGNGEILVFEMGKPVSILDLAKRMIAQENPGPDTLIKFTSLSPGEKLHEQIWHENEVLKETSHPKIKIAISPSDHRLNIRDTISFLTRRMRTLDEKRLQLLLQGILRNPVGLVKTEFMHY